MNADDFSIHLKECMFPKISDFVSECSDTMNYDTTFSHKREELVVTRGQYL